MTALKTTVLLGSIAGAFALGVATRPYIVHDQPVAVAPAITQVAPAAAPMPVAPKPASARIADRAATAEITQALVVRVKPLLKTGTNMTIAMQGFTRGEDFAAVAHAANNLDIPFMVLKHRVLDQHMSLAKAIHDSRPDLTAEIEANRARAEARSDVVATMNEL